MYTTTILATIATAASLTTALPSATHLTARQDVCFPWYLNPQNDGSCQAQGTPSQASGPAPGRTAICQSLNGNWGAMAMNLNGNDGNACGTPYSVALYTTLDCSDETPFNTTQSSCFTAPQGLTWVAYSARPVVPQV